MLISDGHQFIFFHIGKTGGMSMRDVLSHYAREPEKFKIRRPPETTINGEKNPMHEVWKTLLLHAKAIDAKKELPAEVFDGYFKFAFVRNPWDWQVSAYHFILREPESTTHEAVKSTGSFENYLEWVVNTPTPYPKGITKHQHQMITDAEDNLLVDFIGRYETLHRDFAYLRERLGIGEQLPHVNKSWHRDYRDYYNDHTRALVARHFAEDIERFAYTFDGYSRELNVI